MSRVSFVIPGFVAAVFFCTALTACVAPEPEVDGFKLEDFPRPGEAPVLKLLSAGTGEKRWLRYALAAGSTHKVVTIFQGNESVEIDGRASPLLTLPTVKMLEVIKVVEASESGARLEISMPGEPEISAGNDVDPKVIEKVRDELRGFGSILVRAALTDRGFFKEVQVRGGQDASPALLERVSWMMEQRAFPFPAEPVGVGARWKVLARIQPRALFMYSVASAEILQLDGPRVTVKTTIEQLTPQQDLALPERPAGVKARVVQGKARGTGQTVLDLRSLAGRTSYAFDSELLMHIQAAGKADITTKVNMHLQLDIVPASGN